MDRDFTTAGMVNIIVDSLIVAMSLALLFYGALRSFTGQQYAGAGFQYGDQIFEAVLLLIICALGTYRLVADLRRR